MVRRSRTGAGSLRDAVRLAGTVLALWSCGGQASTTAPPAGTDGAAPRGLTGYERVHGVNALIRENYDAACRVCGCGGFLAVTPAVEACVGALVDHDVAWQHDLDCEITALEHEAVCLRSATGCDDTNACTNAKTAERAACPPFSATPSEANAISSCG